jgi:hypothetical protein
MESLHANSFSLCVYIDIILKVVLRVLICMFPFCHFRTERRDSEKTERRKREAQSL